MTSPYIGLASFTEDNQEFFFGRERETRVIASNLHHPITIFYGPSGAGKSSVIRAGVVPYLKKHSKTVIYHNDWQSDNFYETLLQKFSERNVSSLDEFYRDWLKSDRQLFLLLDQFEEYLFYQKKLELVEKFDALLASMVNRDDVNANVLISIRDDALSTFDQRFGIRIPDLLGNTLALRLLSEEAAQRAITEPLKVLNSKYPDLAVPFSAEPALVHRLIDEVRNLHKTGSASFVPAHGRDPNVEPAYLQLLLQKLWEQERLFGSNVLRLPTLQAIGGSSQILVNHVNEVMGKLADEAEREIAACLFDHLVTPSGIKLAQRKSDLFKYAYDHANAPEDRVCHVLNILAEDPKARILRHISNPEAYELFHDVLASAVREWCFNRKLLQAKRAEQTAFVRELITASDSIRDIDPERALGLAFCATHQIAEVRDQSGSDAALSALATSAEESLFQSLRLSYTRVTFNRHDARVSGLAYDPTGQWIATVSEDGTARVWNALSAEEVCVFRPDTRWLYSVAFDKHGKSIFVAAENGSLLLCSLESRRVQVLRNFSREPLYCLAFNKKTNCIAVAGLEGEIWIVSLHANQSDTVLHGHKGAVYSLAFNDDGTYLASGGEDLGVHIWDMRSRQAIVLRGHTGFVKSVAFSSDGRLLVSASHDGSAKLWQPPSKRVAKTFYSGYHWLTSAAFSPDGKLLATGGTNNRTTVWDVARGFPDRILIGHREPIRGIAYSRDGSRVATASSDATARIWQIGCENSLVVEAHDGPVRDISFSPDGRQVATGGDDRVAKLWNAGSGELLRELEPEIGDVNALAFDRAGEVLVTASWDGALRVYDLVSQFQSHTFRRKEHLLAIACSANGDLVATAGDDNLARIWQLSRENARTKLRELSICSGHKFWVNALAFSPDAKFLATTSDDKSVVLWDVESGKKTAAFTGADAFQGVGFASIGHTSVIVAASHDGTARVWDLDTGQPRAELRGHTKLLRCLAVSPDRRCVVTGSADWTAKVWNLDNGEAARTISGHTGEIWRMAFSPDGRYLATASLDKTVRLWDVSTGEEVQVLNRSSEYKKYHISSDAWLYRVDLTEMQKLACARLPKSFREDKCRQYLQPERTPP